MEINKKTIGLIILALIIIGIGVYFGYTKYKAEPTTEPQVQQIEEPEDIEDNTGNYRNRSLPS